MCKSCDIKVYKFENYKWNDKVINYLFFRSNFGNINNLKKGLILDNDCVSFGCGCKGLTVNKPKFLEDFKDFNWFCLGH